MKSAHIDVRLTPRASVNALKGWEGPLLRVSVTAPPVDGKANEALIALLAKALRHAKSRIRIVSGETSRNKTVEVEGLTNEEVHKLLGGTPGAANGDPGGR